MIFTNNNCFIYWLINLYICHFFINISSLNTMLFKRNENEMDEQNKKKKKKKKKEKKNINLYIDYFQKRKNNNNNNEWYNCNYTMKY